MISNVWTLFFLLTWGLGNAIIPTAVLEIKNKSLLFVSPSSTAGWGGILPVHKEEAMYMPISSLADDPTGCTHIKADAKGSASIFLLDRGNCSFLEKAKHAQVAGANALIIRNTRRAVYENDMPKNSTQDAVHAPYAYDCSRGVSYILELASPPWETDSVLCSTNKACTSKMCMPTGQWSSKKGGYQLCCIWDTFTLLGANQTESRRMGVTIPVVMTTIREGMTLSGVHDEQHARIYMRNRPFLDPASILVWLLGIFSVLLATYGSAENERKYADADQFCDQNHEAQVEISMMQAIIFMILASFFLLLLYYFVAVSSLLTWIYALLSIVTTAIVLWKPLIVRLFPQMNKTNKLVRKMGCNSVAECIAIICGGAMSAWWVEHRHSEFSWVIRNIFGECICIVFLKSIRVPNLKVACVLLSTAFLYDIFFVFLSPMIFGSSVMIEVAMGGKDPSLRVGYPGIDYCDRYPVDDRCIHPDAVPMLLSIPNFCDYLGGQSMLGLGDIVLPGLLLSYALRVDLRKRPYCSFGFFSVLRAGGYYTATTLGYAFGLLIANCALHLFKTGQPALLYIVPCILSTMIWRAKREGEIKQLWTEEDDAPHSPSSTTLLECETMHEI